MTSKTREDVVEQDSPPGVRAVLFDAEGSDQEISLQDVRKRRLNDGQLLWIDVDLRDSQALAEGSSGLPIEEESLARMKAAPAAPYVQDFEEYFQLNIRSLRESSESGTPDAVECVVGRNWVLTAHREGSNLIDSFLAPVKGETELGRAEGPVFVAIVLDWFLSRYFRAIGDLEARSEEFDESLLAQDVRQGSDERLLRRLIELRHDVTVLRRNLSDHRETFAMLSQPEFDKISKSESADRFQLLSARLDKAIAAAENVREMTMSSVDIVMTRTAQRTNDAVKILTLVSAVLLPALVIAGILGMNFRQSFFERSELFWVVLLAMAALGISILAIARRRGWF